VQALEQDRIVRKEQKRRARAVQEYRAARAESAAAQEQAAQLVCMLLAIPPSVRACSQARPALACQLASLS
jgi:hypothetical protein